MILAEFLSFKKFDIEEDIINNPTSFTVDSLTQAISDSINLLRPIRPSSQRTAKVIKSIMEKHMRKRGIGWYYDEYNHRVPDTWVHERTIESDMLKLWLYRFSEQNLSFNNAYNALVPYLNTGNAFPVSLRKIEDTELIEFIRKDEEEESKSEIKKDTQLFQEYAAITRPLSTSFPSFRTLAALKHKKQPAQLKKALSEDFNEFNSKIDLVPNNESDRQKMIDQLDSFSVQYTDWNFKDEESKKIVSIVPDGRRDDIIFNTICKLKDLKDDNSYRNVIDEIDNYINIISDHNKIKNTPKMEDQNNNHFDIDASFLIVKDPDNDDDVFKNVRYIEFPLIFKQKDGEKYSIPIYNDFCKLLFSNRLSIKQFKPNANEFTDNIQNINYSDENPSPSYFDLTYTDELRGIFENAYKIGFEKANDWFNYTYPNPYIQLRNIFTRYNFEEVQEFVYDRNFIILKKSDLTDMGYKSCIFSRLLDVKNSYPIEYDEFIKEKSKIKDKTDVSLPPQDDSPEKIFPTIDKSKYDSDLIYQFCNKKLFQCNRNVYDDFLVLGIGNLTKINWLDKKWGCKAQLRAFINEITNQTVKPKPINLMFNCVIDSDTTIGKLNIEIFTLLKSCKTQKV